MNGRIRKTICSFRADETGAALVEFALLLPTFLLFLGISVEGARTFWSYQSTITGVRDAARYLSRAVPQDICETGGTLSAWNDRLTTIVRDTQSGESLFPSSVSIDSVTATLTCTGGYRGGSAPVARVTAALTIQYPFKGFFALFDVDLTSTATQVSDTARIIGA